MSDFVKFVIPDDLKVLQEDVVKKISKSGKIKIGINEVTKSIERGLAKLVIIAEDVSPQEIVMHVPVIAKEKKIPFSYAKTKIDLGRMVGISAKASCVAITDAGSLQKDLTSLIEKIDVVASGKKPTTEKEISAEKKEKPKADKKEAAPKQDSAPKPDSAPKQDSAPKPDAAPKPDSAPKQDAESEKQNKE